MTRIEDQFKAALSRWASGVAVILVNTPSGPRGITISAFMSGSLRPPLVCFAINKETDFVSALDDASRFSLNILNEDQAVDSHYWAGWADDPQSEIVEGDKLSFIHKAHAHLTLAHHAKHDCGDHILYIAELISAESYDSAPLIYYRGSYGV